MTQDRDAEGRALEALLAGVAHDLRNPLNTFAMSTGLLKDDLEREDVDIERSLALVRRMERATVRMQRLIEDLAEASKLEAHGIDLTRKPENVAAIVHEAVGAAKPLAEERGVTIAAGVVDPDLTVVADRACLVQALVKAAAFVLKSAPERSAIRVAASQTDGTVEWIVDADGPNATPGRPTSPSEAKCGLALLIARGLLEAHGGAVDASDDRPRVVLRLPARA